MKQLFGILPLDVKKDRILHTTTSTVGHCTYIQKKYNEISHLVPGPKRDMTKNGQRKNGRVKVRGRKNTGNPKKKIFFPTRV